MTGMDWLVVGVLAVVTVVVVWADRRTIAHRREATERERRAIVREIRRHQ